MKISKQYLWTLIWCWQQKINVQQVKSLINLSIPTIRRYYELFRDHINTDFDVILAGNVQTDEIFVKGAFIIGAKDTEKKNLN